MGWTDWGLNPGGGEIFCTCPEWPLSPHSLLYNRYWFSFPGVKQLGATPSGSDVKERVELYLYSCCEPS